MRIVLSGTAKQLKQQLDSMKAYYGKQALMCDVIRQEAKGNE